MIQLKVRGQGRSQDGSVGRHGVSVSPQLGCLLAIGRGLWPPRRWEEPQSEPVECRGDWGGEEKWKPEKIGAPEAGEIRRGRWEGLSGKSERGPEGDCLAHSGWGACWDPKPVSDSKAPPSLRGSWGHRRGTGEIRSGRWEGPSRKSRREVEGDCPAHSDMGSLLSSQASPLPSKAPCRLCGSLWA